jgi:hypothetical protein
VFRRKIQTSCGAWSDQAQRNRPINGRGPSGPRLAMASVILFERYAPQHYTPPDAKKTEARGPPWLLSSALSAPPRGMQIALKDQLDDRIGDCLTLEFAGNRLRCLERPMLSELV